MQFQPPSQGYNNEVNVPIIPPAVSHGVDHNGIVVGRWKTGLFDFGDSLVPNGNDLVFVAEIVWRYLMLCLLYVFDHQG